MEKLHRAAQWAARLEATVRGHQCESINRWIRTDRTHTGEISLVWAKGHGLARLIDPGGGVHWFRYNGTMKDVREQALLMCEAVQQAWAETAADEVLNRAIIAAESLLDRFFDNGGAVQGIVLLRAVLMQEARRRTRKREDERLAA